jgi:3-hydroxybutyryl-CoA dehydrogenase
MGAGIAQVGAQAGYEVMVFDAFPGAKEKAQSVIRKSLDKLAEKQQLKESADQVWGRLSFVSSIQDLAAFQPDLVIEAITENVEVKLNLYRELDSVMPAKTILASNTSSIPITKIGAATKRPEKVVGMHFMNPVPLMKLVEVIPGLATSKEVLDLALNVSKEMGKTTIVSKDMPAFVVNRVLMPLINEAFFALGEGLASAEDIDTGVCLGLNHPMGPLTLADFVGLETCLAILEVLHKNLGEDKYRPAPLLRQYVEAGWYGKKSGRGVYKWDAATGKKVV